MSLPNAGTGGIVVDEKKNIPIGRGILRYAKWEKPTGNGSHRIDGAAFPIEYAGGILFALHNREIKDYLTAVIFDFYVASIVIIKSIYDISRLFPSLFRYGSDILFCEVYQIGLLPEILDLL